MSFIMIGHENYVNSELISVILKPGSSPVKRLRQLAGDKGFLLDASAGNKTRSVIVLTTGQVVLSSVQPVVVRNRTQRSERCDTASSKQGSNQRSSNQDELYDEKDMF